MLQAARDELAADTLLARGGLQSLGRYSDRVDDLLRQIYRAARGPDRRPRHRGGAGRLRAAAAVHALGHRPAVRVRQPDRRARGALPAVDAAPALGPAPRRRTPRPRTGRPGAARHRQSRVPGRVARGPLPRRGRSALRAAHDAGARERAPPGAARCCGPRDLLEQRHGQFNRTLYHLEPDIKNAPGALRDISAVRDDHAVRGSGATARRAGQDRAGRRGRGLPAPAPVDPAPEDRTQPQRADPRAAGSGPRRCSGRPTIRWPVRWKR